MRGSLPHDGDAVQGSGNGKRTLPNAWREGGEETDAWEVLQGDGYDATGGEVNIVGA